MSPQYMLARRNSWHISLSSQLINASLWHEENGRRHGKSPIPSTKLVRIIDENVRNWFSTIRQLGNSVFDEGLRYWFHTRSL
ncbi:hypothetical protein V5N11_001117 [Cardamine amara subsp. amara]|uniref:Maturase K n=1 Tax=Cardamine amara subsp. amara TaxID=228776 RepID=A0ABD1C5D2_CARAN